MLVDVLRLYQIARRKTRKEKTKWIRVECGYIVTIIFMLLYIHTYILYKYRWFIHTDILMYSKIHCTYTQVVSLNFYLYRSNFL